MSHIRIANIALAITYAIALAVVVLRVFVWKEI